MDWFTGAPLLEYLETVSVAADRDLADVRFPVQWVIRPMSDEHHDYRGYAGQVAAGVLRPDDEVVVLPSGQRTRIAAIDTYDGERDVAFPPMSVTLRLGDDLDVSRGDMIVGVDAPPVAARELVATVCWMSDEPLRPRGRYVIRHTTREARAIVDAIEARVDVNDLSEAPADALTLNAIGRVRLRCSAPLMVDPYAVSRETGSFILVDEARGDTVAAGMVLSAS
jgi:bifunctional enzyme CysN/CysC/sulfate adenylyltransferase subunit 1